MTNPKDQMPPLPASKLIAQHAKPNTPIYDYEVRGYTADDMHDYARAHAAALAERIAELEASNKRLTDGLIEQSEIIAAYAHEEKQALAARQPVETEPVAWIESEPSTRGGDIIEVINGMCHTVMWHRKQPTTGNPVWSVYAGVAAQPATVGAVTAEQIMAAIDKASARGRVSLLNETVDPPRPTNIAQCFARALLSQHNESKP